MELSTYFRINAANTGQFERTLIIAEDSSYVSYLEGCTAPMRDENQLHAVVVELLMRLKLVNIIAGDVKDKLLQVTNVKDGKVDVVFDPPWSYDNLEEEARLELGLI
jgi:hypothetical protein